MSSPPRTVSTWAIDPDHSSVEFALRYMGIGSFRARFRSFAGTIRVDEADPAASSVAVTIPVDGVDIGNQALRDWLLGEGFLNQAAHPEIAFRSTGLRHVEEARWQVDGLLTLAGRTCPVALATTYDGQVHHPFAGRPMAAFSAETTIRRSDFGLGWNLPLDSGAVALGDDVRVNIAINAFRQD